MFTWIYRITKSENEEHINIKIAESEEIVDSFEGVMVTWKYLSQPQKQREADDDNQEKKIHGVGIWQKLQRYYNYFLLAIHNKESSSN